MTHVDGVKIFPKLAINIRTYYEKWKKNWRIKDAIHESKNLLNQLKNLFHIADDYFFNDTSIANLEIQDNKFYSNAPPENSNIIQNPLPPRGEPAIDLEQNHSQIVGGIMIGIPDLLEIGRKRFRGKDMKQRKKRVCSWCSLNHPTLAITCRGRGGAKFCEYKVD